MDVLVVQGRTELSGSVTVSGSKNTSLPIMAAALLTNGTTTLQGVPELVDTSTMAQLLAALGCRVERSADKKVTIEQQDEHCSHAPYELVRRMRAGICVLGPLLARRGYARVSLPGGCNLGHRPIDVHLRGLAALGAEISITHGDIVAQADQLIGTEIDLEGPNGSTVTGTCNVLSAATLARGRTVIQHAACEPEVVALADFLNAMGAQINGQGTTTLEVNGVEQLQAADWTISPDRIEAGTFLLVGALSPAGIVVENINISDLASVIDLLDEMGVSVHARGDMMVEVRANQPLKPVKLTTLPYPGFPTDLQAPLTAILSTVAGRSFIRDQIFSERFMHCAELNRMGANIRHHQGFAQIHGVPRLQGAHVMASDLRAGAALVLAGLLAEGETIVHRVYHLDRGYEHFEQKLTQLGANIVRCAESNLHLHSATSEPFTLRRPA